MHQPELQAGEVLLCRERWHRVHGLRAPLALLFLASGLGCTWFMAGLAALPAQSSTVVLAWAQLSGFSLVAWMLTTAVLCLGARLRQRTAQRLLLTTKRLLVFDRRRGIEVQSWQLDRIEQLLWINGALGRRFGVARLRLREYRGRTTCLPLLGNYEEWNRRILEQLRQSATDA